MIILLLLKVVVDRVMRPTKTAFTTCISKLIVELPFRETSLFGTTQEYTKHKVAIREAQVLVTVKNYGFNRRSD